MSFITAKAWAVLIKIAVPGQLTIEINYSGASIYCIMMSNLYLLCLFEIRLDRVNKDDAHNTKIVTGDARQTVKLSETQEVGRALKTENASN